MILNAPKMKFRPSSISPKSTDRLSHCCKHLLLTKLRQTKLGHQIFLNVVKLEVQPNKAAKSNKFSQNL
jgi:hypothetical protein